MPATNYEVIDKVGMPHVFDYIKRQLAAFDTAALDWIKLLPLNKSTLLHGECTFPGETRGRRVEHGFRIRASVNVLLPPPYTYDHWGRIPSPRHEKGWTSGEQRFYFSDLEECAVHTLSHECFHFLSESNQLNVENSEANANWWGDRWLATYQTLVDRGGQLRLF